MELSKLIIHEIKKESESNVVELDLSNELVPINDDSIALVNSLSSAYKSDKILYAIFNEEEGKYFPEKFSEFRASGRSENDFVLFTRNVTGNLETIIRPIRFATGGYLIYAEYIENTISFISVFFVRDVEGKILSKTDNSYAISTIEYVDTKNLAMACRINETRLESAEGNYLSFTQLKQQEVSEYFKDWISILQLESSSKYTSILYSIISSLEPPLDEETGKPYELQKFRDQVYNYISSSPTKSINIRDLGEHFFDDPDIIADYATEHDFAIDTEFRYNKRQLQKFIKLEVNRDGINLKVSRGTLDEKIRLSDDNPDIVIIESKSFAKAIRQEKIETDEHES